MNQWTRLPLSDLIAEGDKINYGVVQPGDALEKGVPLVRAGDVISSEINPSHLKRISSDIDKKYKKSRLVGDEILIACVGSIGTVGLANPLLAGANIARAVARVRCNDLVFRKYLYWYLRSPEPQRFFNQETRTVSQPTLNIREIEQTPIPLPPIAEQKRIAAILDKAEELRGLRRQALGELDALTQSIFLEMFGEPVTNPKGLPIKPVGDLADCIVPGRDKPKSFSGGIPWITTEDLIYLGITTASPKQLGLTSAEINQVRARIIPKGSVILSCVGELGITSIAGTDIVINQQLHSFQCGQNINNVFLMYCLSFQKTYMRLQASSTTVLYMNKSVCNSIPVILPPLSLQKEFARRVEEIEQLKATHRESLAHLDTLFASLQHRAFRGEL